MEEIKSIEGNGIKKLCVSLSENDGLMTINYRDPYFFLWKGSINIHKNMILEIIEFNEKIIGIKILKENDNKWWYRLEFEIEEFKKNWIERNIKGCEQEFPNTKIIRKIA